MKVHSFNYRGKLVEIWEGDGGYFWRIGGTTGQDFAHPEQAEADAKRKIDRGGRSK